MREPQVWSNFRLKTFLKWAGGKSKLSKDIKKYFTKRKTLGRAFCRVKSLIFLTTTFEEYLLCDTNSDLINLYNNLKQSPDELLEKTNEFFSAENNTESKFYELREEFNALESKDMRKSALLFI